jgi:hypothetical protein
MSGEIRKPVLVQFRKQEFSIQRHAINLAECSHKPERVGLTERLDFAMGCRQIVNIMALPAI